MDALTEPLIGFKRHLRVETGADGTVYLISARGSTALSGEDVKVLAPFLDGTHTLPEIVTKTSPALTSGQVGSMIGRLAACDLVGRHEPADEPETAAFWDLAGATPPASATVAVIALAGLDPLPMIEACASAGLEVRAAAVADVVLVCCEDYLDPALAEVDARMRAEGRRWLLVKLDGPDLWIGPVFQPGGDGPCWACLATRLRGQRRAEARLWREIGGEGGLRPPSASLPSVRAIGVHVVALEAAKAVARSSTQLDGIWTLNTLTLEAAHHPVQRRAQCSECGDPGLTAERMLRPVVTRSRPKAETAANGHRSMTAEQMWRRHRHLADPVTGIMEGVTRDPRSPDFLPCYRSGPNLAYAGGSLRQSSSGKGRTELEAKVGALCEAVERYCGALHGDEARIRGRYDQLGAEAVHPDACQLFHPRQYRDRRRWNAANLPFQHVPEPFDEGEVLDWTPLWSLTTGQRRLLPTDLLFFRGGGSHPAFRANSNGNAAGSSREDAIVQGFLELVERDAVAVWWYNRTSQPAVDLDSMDDPWISELNARYAKLNRRLWMIDVSHDLGIPVMAAISCRTDKLAQDIMLGFGAHFDPRVAARRALTELGQLLPAALDEGAADAQLRLWWQTATTTNQPYLLPDPGLVRRVEDYSYTPRADLGADVAAIRELADAAGLEVLVLDQTRADVGVPVVKVVVPGLRHFWARFAPGRLYDVPVRLGRRATPVAYEDLNPVPLFF